ncbi:MAG: hypothetical protein ACR2QK_20485, partial [Acidimicrobiales bacterium]
MRTNLQVVIVATGARIPVEGFPLAVALAAVGGAGDARRAGVLIGVGSFPQFVTGPLAGRVLDRSRRPTAVLAGAAAICAAAMALLGLGGLTGWSAFAAAGLLAATAPALTGGLSGVFTTWDGDRRLSAWDGTGYNVAGLAAPAMVTALIVVDARLAFLALAVGAMPAIPILAARTGSGRSGSGSGRSGSARPAAEGSASRSDSSGEPAGVGRALAALWRAPQLRAVTTTTT